MIAALMVYSLAISTLIAAAAVAAERLARLVRQPARFVWLAAIIGAIVLSAVRFVSGLAPVAIAQPLDAPPIVTSVAPTDVRPVLNVAERGVDPVRAPVRAVRSRVTALRIRVTAGSPVTMLDQPLLVAWIACSVIGLLVIVISTLRLVRPSVPWRRTIVDGVPVLVSHDLGPAIIGLFRYRIVLPEWALELESVERDLVLAHEREHAAAGDPWLFFGAMVVVALSPWNAAFWWMAHRLRAAVELDCDARVLRARPNPAAYGALLIDVSERTFGGAAPIVGLAEPASLIERRIAAMTSRMPRFAVLRGGAAVLAAGVPLAIACAAPHPVSVPAPRPLVLVDVPAPVVPVVRDVGAPRRRIIDAPVIRTVKPTVIEAVPEIATASVVPLPTAQPDSIFDRLFDGISLTPAQAVAARDILSQLEQRQNAQDELTRATIALNRAKTAVAEAERNVTLRALLTTDAARATFDTNAAWSSSKDAKLIATPSWITPTFTRRGDSSRTGRLDSAFRQLRLVQRQLIWFSVQISPNLVLARLFDGISLTADQESSARAVIEKFQPDVAPPRQPRPPAVLRVDPASGLVSIRAPSDLALIAIVSDEGDRAKLRARIMSVPQ